MSQIVPFLWFDDQAEEAVNFYVSVFNNSRIGKITRYGDAGPGPEGLAMVIEFQLNGQDFMALNATVPAAIEGRPPIAMYMTCDTQDEVDAVWDKLVAGGEGEPCGWLNDKYGKPWNIVPRGFTDLIASDDPDRSRRAMQVMFTMTKLDINELRRALDGAAH